MENIIIPQIELIPPLQIPNMDIMPDIEILKPCVSINPPKSKRNRKRKRD